MTGRSPGVRIRAMTGRRYGHELTEEILEESMLPGRWQYVGTLDRYGEIVDYYRLEEDGQVTFVYSVRE